LALSDAAGTLATPLPAVKASGIAHGAALLIAELVARHEAHGVVVGLPLNMDGSEGTQARISRRFAECLKLVTTVPVVLWDERLTTFAADQTLAEAGVSRGRRRALKDSLAARELLQSFLDAQPADGEGR